MRCSACGSIGALTRAGDPLKPAEYVTYHQQATYQVPEVIKASLDTVVASAEPYRHAGRWLDLGFGEGSLLSAAERRGWSCYGTEVSPHALAFGRSRGWIVSDAASGDPRFAPEGFDVVTLVEVIEHLADPIEAIRQAVQWLRPDGLLFLTTPNANSLNRLLLGQHWSVFCPPEHLTIWTRSGLTQVLRALGVALVQLRTHGLNPAEIFARLRHPGSPRTVHRQGAALSLNQALVRTPARRALKTFANATLSLLGVGDALKVWGEKRRRCPVSAVPVA